MKRFSLFIVIALTLQGCGQFPMIWGADALPPILISSPVPALSTAVPMEATTPTVIPTLTLTPTVTAVPTDVLSLIPEPPSAKIKRVIVITYDGLRADAVAAAPMPNLLSLMATGAHASARTINYAVTLPAHASLFSGTCQSKHGVDWDVTTYYKGYSQGVDVWDLAHAAGLKTVMIVNKEKLRQLAEPETTDVFEVVYGIESTIMKAAIDQIPNGFDLMFVHFGSGDTRGHKYGWMSNAQFKAYRDGDAALGELLAALDQSGLRDSTLILVTADHGGHDQTHIGTVIEDLLIPWVLNGPGIVPGEITTPVSIMDSAPTIAYALELPFQPEWDGMLVYQAFGLPVETMHIDNICKK